MKLLFFIFLFSAISLWSQTNSDSIVMTTNAVDTTIISVKTNPQVEQVHFSEHFKEKYQERSFIYEEQSAGATLWERFSEWFIQRLKRAFDIQDSQKALTILDYTINVIAVLLIAIAVFLIVKAILNKEGTWIFGSKSDAHLIRYEEIEKNLHLTDFEKLIKDSIHSGENRLSIRYYYLYLLKKMSEKQLIEWDVEKTNSDYIYEIKSPQLKTNFEYLSYLYNYIWYGEFDLSLEEFEKAKKAFDATIQSIY